MESNQGMEIVQSIFRWAHVIAGILWIGLLYFFNWVNTAFAPTMDADSKRKVVPQLMPRSLFWFRWGAAWTWVTGIVLLLLVYYHGNALHETGSWSLPTFVMLAVTFLMVFLYDALVGPLAKNLLVGAVILTIIVACCMLAMLNWAGWSYRGMSIHIGAMFGTMMAFNVWFRIWPSQQKIITAIRDGNAPDPAWVGLAGSRSKHNTYLSFPLVWLMLNQHTTWAASSWYYTLGAVVVGWWFASMMFRKAPKVPGF